MDSALRIEQALAVAVARADVDGAPPKLVEGMRYAVFPGGARMRPRLCLEVARACGEDVPTLSDAAAVAIELLHCASLVHDDLPCFDDAPVRRGKLALHRAFDERIAVLSGDALIVLAFEALAVAGAALPRRLATILPIVARSVGAPTGIVAGQAWECEPQVDLVDYQRAKTGALFAGATMAGAAAAGAEPGPWRTLGEKLGEAYQVVDDIRDVAAHPDELGKPIGQDVALDRPSAARELGIPGAVLRLEQLVADAIASIPSCSGALELRAIMLAEMKQLLPKSVSQRAS
jgi:geranylgeranyl diphosphate synthase, type II